MELDFASDIVSSTPRLQMSSPLKPECAVLGGLGRAFWSGGMVRVKIPQLYQEYTLLFITFPFPLLISHQIAYRCVLSVFSLKDMKKQSARQLQFFKSHSHACRQGKKQKIRKSSQCHCRSSSQIF